MYEVVDQAVGGGDLGLEDDRQMLKCKARPYTVTSQSAQSRARHVSSLDHQRKYPRFGMIGQRKAEVIWSVLL